MTTKLTRPGHDEDFHAWALDQAWQLRALAGSGINAPIDWELVADEVEDMARRDEHACASFIELIIVHFLKIEYVREPTSIPHWLVEIVNFRVDLERAITPTIRRRLAPTLGALHARATRIAGAAMASDPGFRERLPLACPYTFEQVIGDWLPERALTGPAP